MGKTIRNDDKHNGKIIVRQPKHNPFLIEEEEEAAPAVSGRLKRKLKRVKRDDYS